MVALLMAACSSVMPKADYPRPVSVALAHPQSTLLGALFAREAAAHGGRSGFRIISTGVNGFLIRVQMIDAAQRTLDVQYFIFRGDQTGRLITDALRRAAARGVRVRVLVDDGDTVAGSGQLLALDGQPNLEIRVFDPFAYRGHSEILRGLEFLFDASRLDYRMHNKLLIADNSIALIGGRNIGNQYFQMDPHAQVADDDVFSAGPIVKRLSATFDEFWNSRFAIPARALGRTNHRPIIRSAHRWRSRQHRQLASLAAPGTDYVAKIASGEPYAGIISGRLPLVWAWARVVCDSPDKKNVRLGERLGQLMQPEVAVAAAKVTSRLLIITPYLVPAPQEMKLLAELRRRGVTIRILTNSLMSASNLLGQSGYMHYRVALLEEGIDLYEIRSQLGNIQGSGQTQRISRFGNYSLHAKQFVFGRHSVFFGSMNFDQRSRDLNTEVGVIIDSPKLAAEAAARFKAMTEPENAYRVRLLAPPAGSAGKPHLVWDTVEDGKPVEYDHEPSRSAWRRLEVELLSLLHVDGEL
jgi:putative cardiolipin synthase